MNPNKFNTGDRVQRSHDRAPHRFGDYTVLGYLDTSMDNVIVQNNEKPNGPLRAYPERWLELYKEPAPKKFVIEIEFDAGDEIPSYKNIMNFINHALTPSIKQEKISTSHGPFTGIWYDSMKGTATIS
jgi:hypothetical protein